jgi:A/G-specific adenine glycosylase
MAATSPTGLGEPLAAIVDWWEVNARELPWRESRDVYAIWVSEVMSAQTSVARAGEAWVRWMARWPTVEDLARAQLADVLIQWQGLGYPRRARDLHRSAGIVAADGWPQDLTELPGVGAYVAAAVRCFAYEEPVIPLDVNIRRVLARRFPEGVQVAADPWRSGQALMEFGQRICTSRPRCGDCPARSGCPAAGDGGPDPAPRTRRQAPYRGSLRERRGKLLARVLRAGDVALEDADHEAAQGLVADGLLALSGGHLRPPSAPSDPQ